MTVSAATAARLQRTNDSGGVLALLELDHAALSAPVRLVSDTRDHVIGGVMYIGLAFTLNLPRDVAKEAPRAQLRMDNVGRDLTAELERLPPGAALQATLKLVHRTAPTVVDYQFTAPLSGIRVDTATVTASMSPGDLLRRPAVKLRHDPVASPGLFPD